MRFAATTLSVFVLFGLSTVAGAETLKVPGDHATIQAAVDAANDGDTISIKRGTYPENVVIDGTRAGENNLTIRGAGKPTINPGGVGIGLQIVNATGITVTGIQVTAAGDDGINVLDSTNITLSKITCSDNGDSGVEIGGSDNVTVEKGKFDDNGDDGVHFSSDSGAYPTNCTVEKCKMSGGASGISGGGSGHRLIKNTMKETNADSVSSDEDSSGWMLDRNKVISSRDDGYDLHGSNHTCTRNVSKKVADDGLEIDGTGHSVTGDRHIKPSDDGVNLSSNASGVTVTGVKVTGAGEDSFDIDGSGHVLDGCVSIRCKDNGFQNEDPGNTFRNCKAKNSRVFDFADSQEEGVTTLINNKFAPSKVVFDD
jgi:parallel beta-helix repeat protein